ncbi:acyl carrier protein [Paenibacillus phyllosphaerae]|uniref:Acyl carrier protein n=1 Tax=Paenibacillus phyllosphaerae TaxID=274593 RepID=A0A7W5B481_9BACL|nr:acyl carrier protein [Paenibacillus phyllosphaerae]MBB3114053.1 acyl carrier protein [Paenibacillus phyllosphaerae]
MSENTAVKVKIIAKVKEVLDLQNEISPHVDLREIGMASMKTMELLVMLEVVFDISFDEDEILLENLSTVDQIYHQVMGKLSALSEVVS